MGNLSKNLSRHEIACQCGCGYDTIDTETALIFQDCCDHFARTLNIQIVAIIHSGARCLQHNRTVGSKDTSWHVDARAIDFHIEGVTPADTFKYLDNKHPNRYGLGLYSTFVHADSRLYKARW